MPNQSNLFFGSNNAKLKKFGIATFALPAGHTCPGACECLAKRDIATGRVVNGPKQKFRCYAASLEVAFSSVARSTLRNLNTLKGVKGVEAMTELIVRSVETGVKLEKFPTIRVHTHGDFFNQTYFLAWMEAARRMPEREFYAYTKSLQIWVSAMAMVPTNFVITASHGGKWDHLIAEHNLKSAVVVFSEAEAKKKRLKIDHDDSQARDRRVKKFALLLHGTQSAGTAAQEAISAMKKDGTRYSYSRGAKTATSVNV